MTREIAMKRKRQAPPFSKLKKPRRLTLRLAYLTIVWATVAGFAIARGSNIAISVLGALLALVLSSRRAILNA